jgi:hypothetical protein
VSLVVNFICFSLLSTPANRGKRNCSSIKVGRNIVGKKWVIANSASQGDRQYETTPFPEAMNPMMVKISKRA